MYCYLIFFDKRANKGGFLKIIYLYPRFDSYKVGNLLMIFLESLKYDMEQKILNDCNDFKALVPDFDKRKKNIPIIVESSKNK